MQSSLVVKERQLRFALLSSPNNKSSLTAQLYHEKPIDDLDYDRDLSVCNVPTTNELHIGIIFRPNAWQTIKFLDKTFDMKKAFIRRRKTRRKRQGENLSTYFHKEKYFRSYHLFLLFFRTLCAFESKFRTFRKWVG